MQDGSDELLQMEATGSSGYIDINTTAAVLFVVIASCFLVMLYKLMSSWFLEVLVVLFCIGGAEVCHSSLYVGLDPQKVVYEILWIVRCPKLNQFILFTRKLF